MQARQFDRFTEKFKVLQHGAGLFIVGTHNVPAGSTAMGPEPTRLLELSLTQFNVVGGAIRQLSSGAEFLCASYQTTSNMLRVRLIPVTHKLQLVRPVMELNPITKMTQQAHTNEIQEVLCNLTFDSTVYAPDSTPRRIAKLVTNQSLKVGDNLDQYEVITVSVTAGLNHVVVAYGN
jgi:hypothetical protein